MAGDIQAFNLTFASQGIVLKSTADEIPITAYAKLVNMATTLENAVRVRYGYSQLENGISGVPNSFGFIHTATNNYRYAIGSHQLHVAVAGSGYQAIASGTGMSSTQRATNASFVFLDVSSSVPHIFYADGDKFIHHSVDDTTSPTSSTGNARNVGIPAPADWSASVLPTLASVTTVTIDGLQVTSSWSDLTASVSSIIPNGGYTGSDNAFDITVTGKNVVGGAKKTGLSLNLGDFNTEEIEIWFKWPTADDALCTSEIILTLGIGSGADPFASSYQKVLIPSPLSGAISPLRPVSSVDAVQEVINIEDTKTGSDMRNPGDPDNPYIPRAE